MTLNHQLHPTCRTVRSWPTAVLLALASLACGLAAGIAAAGERDRFTVALIPDTQYYCDADDSGGTAQMYHDLTGWLAQRAKPDNIRFAIHLGDLVQNPDIESEWPVASSAQSLLEWTVPYSVMPGNHDIGTTHDYYNQYFGPDRFAGQSFHGGHRGTTNNNNYCFFNACGMDFMVLSLKFNPSESVLQWADEVVENHPNHRVIVASHEYLSMNGRRTIGNRIWNQLVRENDNIFMVVSGHISGWAHQTSVNDAGHNVIEILSDYQWEPDGLDSTTLGGDGWLNTMEFVPEEDKIHFKSYSPYLNEWRTTDLHQYTLDYAMPDPLPGDTNWNGVVDDEDAQTLAEHWLALVDGGRTDGDFNGDGRVDDRDAAILAAHWQRTPFEGRSCDAVPEPSTSVLALSAFGLLHWSGFGEKKTRLEAARHRRAERMHRKEGRGGRRVSWRSPLVPPPRT